MNDGNLIPLSARSKSEQRAIQSKGGRASGVSRSFKSSLKRKLKDNPSLIDDVIDVLINEAVEGKNLKAADMLIDLLGESVQRESVALKRKELRMKEAAQKNSSEHDAETPMLYRALEEADDDIL